MPVADLDLAIPKWWQRPAPRRAAACYRRKADALNAFCERNLHVIEPWGLETEASGGEFDAVNERYGLRGARRVRSLAEALWIAMPAGAPYCLERMDLDTLNDTAPGREGGGFVLPDAAAEARWTDEEWRSDDLSGAGDDLPWPVLLGGALLVWALFR